MIYKPRDLEQVQGLQAFDRIELLYATNYLDKKEFDFLDSNCIELVKILSNIVATTKKNLNNKL